MDKNIPFKIKKAFFETILSIYFRTWFLIIGFGCLIIVRQLVGTFGISLGYLYVILISLAGFWFAIKGGVITALISSSIFLLEVNIFQYWPGRDLVIQGMFLRLSVYFAIGLTIGYFSEVEKKLKEKLAALAYDDELTGCVNYRWTMRILENEIARCKRYNKELTIIMIDIDHFKRINDMYGHLVGNDVLENFAYIIKANVRTIDIVGRYGGEEFLIILPEAAHDQALIVLERIKSKLSEAKITSTHLEKKAELTIKFSAGVASFPSNGRNVKELLAIADNVLYQAKREGKDRVAVERRRCIRLKPIPGLKVEMTDLLGKGRAAALEVADISHRGMLVLFPHDIPEEEFLCRIYFPEEHVPSEFTCKVAHKTKSKGDVYRVGVYFVDIPTHVQKKLSPSTHPSEESS